MKFKAGDLLLNKWGEKRLVMGIENEMYLICYVDYFDRAGPLQGRLQNTYRAFVEEEYRIYEI